MIAHEDMIVYVVSTTACVGVLMHILCAHTQRQTFSHALFWKCTNHVLHTCIYLQTYKLPLLFLSVYNYYDSLFGCM